MRRNIGLRLMKPRVMESRREAWMKQWVMFEEWLVHVGFCFGARIAKNPYPPFGFGREEQFASDN